MQDETMNKMPTNGGDTTGTTSHCSSIRRSCGSSSSSSTSDDQTDGSGNNNFISSRNDDDGWEKYQKKKKKKREKKKDPPIEAPSCTTTASSSPSSSSSVSLQPSFSVHDAAKNRSNTNTVVVKGNNSSSSNNSTSNNDDGNCGDGDDNNDMEETLAMLTVGQRQQRSRALLLLGGGHHSSDNNNNSSRSRSSPVYAPARRCSRTNMLGGIINTTYMYEEEKDEKDKKNKDTEKEEKENSSVLIDTILLQDPTRVTQQLQDPMMSSSVDDVHADEYDDDSAFEPTSFRDVVNHNNNIQTSSSSSEDDRCIQKRSHSNSTTGGNGTNRMSICQQFDHLKGLNTQDKFSTLVGLGAVETYPADCYSFIAVHSPFKKPQFFFFGIMVFVFQVCFFMYMILNKMHADWGVSGEIDNPATGFIGSKVPANVTGLVRATQITAVLCYVVFADSSVRDCAMGVEKFPRLDRAMDDDRVMLAIISCSLRFIQGFLAIIATFLLIVTSDDVIEIVLNFAAVNFISNLDEVGFELAKWGKYGPVMEREAKSIEERPIPYCVYRKHEHVRYLITVVPIAILLTLAVVLLAVWQESNNYWVSQTIRVQFDDSTGLEYYSGCYDLDVDVTHNKRKNYNSFHENYNSAIFGYCKENRQWILFKDDDAVKGEHLSPCDVTRDNQLARSSQTDSFDVYTSSEESWFTASGTPLDMYFFQSEEQGRDLHETCGAFLNDGYCNTIFNTLEYQFDGGDCCAPTCSHPNCGRGGSLGVFGSNATQGIGFHDCKNPELVPITISLNEISTSRNPNVLKVSESFVEEYNLNRGVDFWTETPAKAFVNIDCDHAHVLSMYIDDTMKRKTETVYVEDGASCDISVSNTTDDVDKSYNPPIWYIDYTIYHGNDTTNEMISCFSGQLQTIDFKRIPECYFDKLSDYIKVSSAYTAGIDMTHSLSWLVDEDSEYSQCDNPFLIERYALGAIYFGAPAHSSVVTVDNSVDNTDTNWTDTDIYWNDTDFYRNDTEYNLTTPRITEYIMPEKVLEIKRTDYAIPDIDDTNVWLKKEHHCRWVNVVCNEGTVESLLIHKDLDGTISTSIGLLTGLTRLEYEESGVYGTIPSEIGLLTKLTGLNIDTNGLSGTLPTELGKLTGMIYFDADFNGLTGTIPTEIGRMKLLKDLDVRSNMLFGQIPEEVFALKQLVNLEFDNNLLSGTISKNIGLLTELRGFLAANNTVTSTIPSEIGQLKKLTQLDLKNNTFVGTIPTQIGLMTSLITLDLRGNAFEGPIPSEIGAMRDLREIRLEGNKLTGSIPFQISFLQRLVVFTSDDLNDEDMGSLNDAIKTLKPCNLCKEQRYELVDPSLFDNKLFYENGEYGIESLNCTELFKQLQDHNQPMSARSCKFLGESCIACGR